MIWLLLFIGVMLLIAPLLWFAGIRKPRPGQTEMVLIGAAASEMEVETWIGALRTAGIQPHVINVGDFGGRFGRVASSPYGYEVWVPAREEAQAKRALGFR
ncbi:MAG TPA: hypothetical protein VLS25_01255 [Dehalococcoidia bacterium]|nr:hypothetical protein [Dehalococcoidia bacterium]